MAVSTSSFILVWKEQVLTKHRAGLEDLCLLLTVLPELLLCQDVVNVDVLLVNQHRDDAADVVAVRHFPHG